MTIKHSVLTGSSLHEPKGASTASTKQVYIANGTGSGAWSTIVPETHLDTSSAADGDVFIANGTGGGSWTQLPGPTYGEMYMHGNAIATSIAAASTYYLVNPTGAWVEGHADNITITEADGKYVVVTDGDYKISCSVSFIGGINTIFEFDFAKNGTAMAHGAIRRKTSNADVGALYLQAIETLAAGDEITLIVQNETNTSNATITDANFQVELKEAT